MVAIATDTTDIIHNRNFKINFWLANHSLHTHSNLLHLLTQSHYTLFHSFVGIMIPCAYYWTFLPSASNSAGRPCSMTVQCTLECIIFQVSPPAGAVWMVMWEISVWLTYYYKYSTLPVRDWILISWFCENFYGRAHSRQIFRISDKCFKVGSARICSFHAELCAFHWIGRRLVGWSVLWRVHGDVTIWLTAIFPRLVLCTDIMVPVRWEQLIIKW